MVVPQLNDLNYIENLAHCGKFTMTDWEHLQDDFSNFIFKIEKGQVKKPIESLYNHFMDVSDISPKFATIAILFLISSVTRLDQKIIYTQGSQHFNLWVNIIGQAGIMRKSSVRKKVQKLLKEVGIALVDNKFSAPAIINVLKRTPQGALIRDEFAILLEGFEEKFNKGMSEALCEVYDCEEEITYTTRSNKREVVNDPYITLWGSTTPNSYPLYTEKLFRNGFLRRFLHCLELKKYKYIQLTFDPAIAKEDKKIGIELLASIIDTEIQEVHPTSMTVAWKTYQNYCDKISMKSEEDELSSVYPYYASVPEFVLKIAGILELTRQAYLGLDPIQPDNYIGMSDDTLNLAVRIVRMFEHEYRQLVRKARSVALSDPVRTEKDYQQLVLDVIANAPINVLSNPELLQATSFNRNKLREVTNTLLEAERIDRVTAPKTGEKGSRPQLFYIKGQKNVKSIGREWANNRKLKIIVDN